MLGSNPYAEEALSLASMARGNQGMLRTSAPVGNERMLSEVATDKVEINDQSDKNLQYLGQNQKQNVLSAIPQAEANAIRGVRKSAVDMSQAEYKAQEGLTRTVSEILYANQGGSALMRLAEESADPAQARNRMQRLNESNIQAMGNNPQTKFTPTRFYG